MGVIHAAWETGPGHVAVAQAGTETGGATPRRRPRRWLERAWALPLWAHGAALSLVLVAFLAVVGTTPGFMPDEGAAVVQARSLSGGHGWVVPDPVAAADPGGRNHPIVHGEQGPRGVAPLAKHPLYAVLLAGADRSGGVAAMLALSMAGTVAAAMLAAALAGRLDPTLARPTAWVVGLASPLFFDSFLLLAHTLAAAAAVAAVLLTLAALERPRPASAVGVVACIATAVLLRNEAVFLAVGLAAAACLWAARRGTGWRPAAVVACACLLGMSAAHLAEQAWVRAVVGGGGAAMVPPIDNQGGSYLAGRVDGTRVSWVAPSHTGGALVVVALLVMAGAIAVGAWSARRRPRQRPGVALPAFVAGAAAVVAVAARPANVVPGLLVAFPLATAGLLLVDRRLLAAAPASVAFTTFGLFALGVASTQYASGGTGEWGGRYFALGIPILVPVVLLALVRTGRRLPRSSRRWAAASLALCSVATAIMSVAGHARANRSTAAVAVSIERLGREVGGPRPVMVTTDPVLPRRAWTALADHRWALAGPGDLSGLVGRLQAAGVSRFGLVTADPLACRTALPGFDFRDLGETAGGRFHRLVVAAPPRVTP